MMGDFEIKHLALQFSLQVRLCQGAIAPFKDLPQTGLTLWHPPFAPGATPPIVCYQWRAQRRGTPAWDPQVTAGSANLGEWTVQHPSGAGVHFTLTTAGIQRWLAQIQRWGEARSLSLPLAEMASSEENLPRYSGRFSLPTGGRWDLCDRLQLSPLAFLQYSHGRCCDHLRLGATQESWLGLGPDTGALPPEPLTRPPYPVDGYCHTLVDVVDTLARHPNAKTYLRQGYRLGSVLHEGLGRTRGTPEPGHLKDERVTDGDDNCDGGWSVAVWRAAQVILAHILHDGFGQSPPRTV